MKVYNFALLYGLPRGGKIFVWSKRMRRALLVYSVAAVLFIVTAHIFAAHVSAREKDHTWTGFVTDTHCGSNRQITKNTASNLRCIQLCVQKGSKYGLWSRNEVYILEPQHEAAKFAAEHVKVTGTMSGDTIHVTSIAPLVPPVATSKQ
jgi:hypothetical protein